MNTKKVAISIPSDLLSIIDDVRSDQGLSRSKFITLLLRQKILDERSRQIKQSYDKVFSDETIVKEQLETAAWFDGSGSDKGQEW